jgi:plastocyanin
MVTNSLRKLVTLVILASGAVAAGCGGSATAPPRAQGPGDKTAAAKAGDGDEQEGKADQPEAEEKEETHVPNQVVIDNFTYRPARLTVKAGTKVTWVNRDDVPHTATSTARPKKFDSGTLDTDQRFSFVFKTPGVYPYFCAVHPHMTATVIVK